MDNLLGRQQGAARVQAAIGNGALRRAMIVSGVTRELVDDLQFMIASALRNELTELASSAAHRQLVEHFLFHWAGGQARAADGPELDDSIGDGPLSFALRTGTAVRADPNPYLRLAAPFAKALRSEAAVLAGIAGDDSVAVAIEEFLFMTTADCLRVELDKDLVERLIATGK